MIASFHYPDHEPVFGNGWNSGWCCCNDVHEIFIAMAEVVLTTAYLIERTDGATHHLELQGHSERRRRDQH